jgi:hypothetical protein
MKRTVLGVVILGLVSWTGCAATQKARDDGEMHTPMTQHYEGSLFKATENGEFSVEVLLPDEKLEMGVNRVDLIVHNKQDKDVAGASIKVIPWMPSMDHGVMEKPAINEKGGGLYNVENVVFSMTGDWELRLEITSGSTTDTVNIPMPAIGAMGHTHSMKAPDTSQIDTSMQNSSMKDHFTVSYKSDVHPVPLNKLHSWNLSVMSADGTPVKGATVKILGDMPEHGHGFPTEPEVSGTMEDGQYAVEGLKFSMPGWWVVTFHITAGDMVDHVSFNLLLQ